jgi:hypothetical protein
VLARDDGLRVVQCEFGGAERGHRQRRERRQRGEALQRRRIAALRRMQQ